MPGIRGKDQICVCHSEEASWARAVEAQKRFDKVPSWNVAELMFPDLLSSKSKVCPCAGKCEKPLQVPSFSVNWSEFNL